MEIRKEAHRLRAFVLDDTGEELEMQVDFPLNGDNIRMKGPVEYDGPYIVKLEFDNKVVYESDTVFSENLMFKHSIQAELIPAFQDESEDNEQN